MIQQRSIGPLHLVTSGDNASGSHMLVISGTALTEGQVVCPVGVEAGHIKVSIANPGSTARMNVPLWICCHGTTGSGQQVRVARIRAVSGVDTSALAVGDLLYLNAAGAIGAVPAGAANDQIVAVVVTAAVAGVIIFDPTIKVAT